MTSSDLARISPHISQENKLLPVLDDAAAPSVVTPVASPKKKKKKSRRAPVHRSGQGKKGDKDTLQDETIPVPQGGSIFDHRPQHLLDRPQGSPLKGVDEQANQNEILRKLELREGGLVAGSLMSKFNVSGPSQSSSWEPAQLTRRGDAAATTTTTEAISARPITLGQQSPRSSPLPFPAKTKAPTGEASSTNNAMGQKLEKCQSKKSAAVEAGQCERRTTDGTVSSSNSGLAARRAMVVEMLSRMAGGPTSGETGAQGSSGGHRDFTFLLPPPAESRKCRLCRNMFTDKSNVKQPDGGAPCSFHPGTYLSLKYVWILTQGLLIIQY